MDEAITSIQYPIKCQTRYMKLLYLRDKSINNPILMKRIDSDQLEPVYDSALCFVFTSYDTTASRNDLTFTTSGKIDKLLRIYPNVDSTIGASAISKRVSMNTTNDNVVLYVAQYYNAFQKGNEWVAAHATDNAAEFRLVMDFSSIETTSKELFQTREEPKAYSIKPNGETEKSLTFESDIEKVFSVFEKNVPKKHTLKMTWRINWENLR
jgi:hypothetical protein